MCELLVVVFQFLSFATFFDMSIAVPATTKTRDITAETGLSASILYVTLTCHYYLTSTGHYMFDVVHTKDFGFILVFETHTESFKSYVN